MNNYNPVPINTTPAHEAKNEVTPRDTKAGQELLFYRLEKHPLTDKQYQACCSNALTTLVLAGAGTGKTSTLLGRIVYLWETGKARDVLALAFAVDAAKEIQQRVEQALPRLKQEHKAAFQARTFHSLGLYIVTQVETKRPLLSKLSDESALQDFLKEHFLQRIASDLSYRQAVYQYFTYIEKKIKQQRIPYRTLNDDYVVNQAELVLANGLYALDIPYVYRAHYVQDVRDPLYRQDMGLSRPYRCSFYLPGQQKFIEILPKAVSSKKSLMQQQQSILERIHKQYGTDCLFYPDTFVLDFQYIKVDMEKPASHSPARMNDLFDVLWAIFMEAKKQAWSLAQLHDFLGGAGLKEAISEQEKAVLYDLLAPLYEAYQQSQKGSIDFEHMIVRATQYVQKGLFRVPWSDVLIDEFQDISASRLALIQAMREQQPDLRLFCVGDDWQTIYQFAGSQLRFIRQVEDFFGSTEMIALDKTFRFHQGLCQISSWFVQQNPLQYKKQLRALREEQEAVVLVEYHESNYTERYQQKHQNVALIHALGKPIFQDIERDIFPPKKRVWRGMSYIQKLKRVVDKFQKKKEEKCKNQLARNEAYLATKHNQQGKSCLFLARFSHDLPNAELLSQWQTEFPFLRLRTSTIHAAKGTEADYVIVLNLTSGDYGLPSEKEDLLHQLSLKSEEEFFPFAQERRVFYVALTRARERVYLCFSKENPSVFIEELKQGFAPRQLRKLTLFSS